MDHGRMSVVGRVCAHYSRAGINTDDTCTCTSTSNSGVVKEARDAREASTMLKRD
jgi:hypothetical protein